MSDDARQPWDQQPDEPLESFARFTAYKALGPGRTLLLAQQVHGGTGKRKKTIDGHWCDESARWNWVDRATAWDVHMLSTAGERLAIAWMGVLSSAVRKCAEQLANPKFTPKTWRDCLAVINAVAPHLTPEVMGPLIARLRSELEPLDSCPLDRHRPTDGYKPVTGEDGQ
jgi:hypothetical protein